MSLGITYATWLAEQSPWPSISAELSVLSVTSYNSMIVGIIAIIIALIRLFNATLHNNNENQ
jgi:hypothetical protein